MEKFVVLLMEQNRGLLEHYRGIVEYYQISLDSMQDMLDTYRASDQAPADGPEYLSPAQEQSLLQQIKSAGTGAADKEQGYVNAIGMPKHVSTEFAVECLDISRSTFYRHVKGQLLFVDMKIGNRPYYLMADLQELSSYCKELRHGKGAWTFAKLSELRAKDQPSGQKR